MSDLEQAFLHTAITEVLPDLPEVAKDILEETLQSLGVETCDDLKFIEAADLLSVLTQYIQIRGTSSFSA